MPSSFEEFSVRRFDDCTVVATPTEIDIANAAAIRARLRAELDTGIAGLIIDMSGTRFCDSTGLSVLVRVQHQAEARQTWLRLVLPDDAGRGPVRKIFAITRLDHVLDVYPSVEQARHRPVSVPTR